MIEKPLCSCKVTKKKTKQINSIYKLHYEKNKYIKLKKNKNIFINVFYILPLLYIYNKKYQITNISKTSKLFNTNSVTANFLYK